MCSGKDKIMNAEGSWELYEKSMSIKKHILYYEDAWHDIWIDYVWKDCLKAVIN